MIDDVIRGDVTFEHEHIEDFVLLRGNGTPIFLLANVVDDIEMGITHVVRGEEHLPNTPKQQLLWAALGHAPPVWAHVPVLVNEHARSCRSVETRWPSSVPRRRLPRRGDDQLSDDARLGARAAVQVADSSSESEIVSWAVIEETFQLEDVTHSPAFFDVKKLAV